MRPNSLRLLTFLLAITPFISHAVPIKITCVGDSLTQGNGASDPNTTSYPAVLGQLLQADGSYQVGNFGSGGAHLLPYSGIYSYTNTTVFVPSVNYVGDVIIIMLGTNDGADDGHYIVPEFTNAYDALIGQYTAGRSPAPRIIVATPPWVPITNGPWNAELIHYTICPIIRSYAATRGYTLVDINLLTWGHPEWSSDGMVHYNDAGYQAMAGAFHTAVTNGSTTFAPVMYVTGNSNSISDGSSSTGAGNGTSFGNAPVSNVVDHVFRIQNAGNTNLLLSGLPIVAISGANASDFTVISPPGSTNILPGNYVEFTVRFVPSASGARVATVSIPNNDAPRSPYDFSIIGTGTLPAPSAFTAYNDIAWAAGQPTNSITLYGVDGNTGSLVDYTTGIGLSAQVTLSGVNATLWPGTGAGYAPAGTPAALMLPTNIVDSVIHYYFDSATATFTGLVPTNFYTFVFYANRDGGYTDRYTTVQIQGADGFTNNSTVGAASHSATTTTIFTGSSHGSVFRYDRVNPGTDGSVVFQFTGYKPCLNSFMVQTPSTNAASTNTPSPSAPSNWTAYNDALWMGSDETYNGTYSTNSPTFGINGPLMTTSGEVLSASVSFNTASAVTLAYVAAQPVWPVGTDAYNLFFGKVGSNNVSDWASGTVGMTLSGLNSNKQYTVALYCSRLADGAQYTDRFTIVTISSVDSFVNGSSAGAPQSTTTVANDTTKLISGLSAGLVARYDAVRPGADGTIVFSLLGTGTNGQSHGYLNAFMVTEASVPPGNTNTVPDSWRIQYFGSTNATNGGIFEDFDHDGFSNYAEWRAGTSPTNAGSLLEFSGIQAPTNNSLVLIWSGVTGKTYAVLQNTNLLTPWTTLQSAIPGIQPLTVYTSSVSAVGRVYWRIKVE